jgi:signal transduction histidine kinase
VKKLHHVITSNRTEVLRDWMSRFPRGATDESITPVEIIDHVPQYLDELTDTLRLGDDLASTDIDRSSTPGKHGVQRFRLGFDLDAVVREYGTLQRCIVEAAKREGVQISVDEYAVLGESISIGIADAVTQYSRQRDAELRRQANEHFAFVAHELRNPLASVQLALDLMKKRQLLPATPLSELMSRGLARTRDLIESALNLTRNDHRIELRRDRFRLGPLVAEAVAESEIAAQHQQVRIDVQVQEDAEIEADQRLIRSALSNLISNAVKFTHQGTSVRVSCTVTDDRVAIDVDDGCGGLPDGAVERMFAPFVQVGSDRSGFGLGLAIAKQAIEAHGGTLHAANHPGEGCTFSIDLPRRLPSA